MPTYQYACTECGDRSEVVQRFTDDPLTVCTACGGKLRKIFSPVGIVFKGSGFYRTDSRNGSSTVPAKEGAASGSSSENGSSGGSDSASGSGGASKDGAAAKDSGGSKTTSSAPAADKKSGPVSSAAAS